MLRRVMDETSHEYDYYDAMEPSPFFHLGKKVKVSDISPGQPPSDGYDYIKLVKLERENIEEITQASLPSPKKVIEKPKNEREWSLEIKKVINSMFVDNRYLVKTQLNKNNCTLKEGECIPPSKDMISWCAFCLGSEAADAIKLSKEASSKYIRDHQNITFHSEGYKPYFRFVHAIEKNDISLILSYAEIWLQHFGASQRLCLWIYALLLVIEKPLLARANNILSHLLHSSIVLRDKVNDEIEMMRLNLIICALKSYFHCKPWIKGLQKPKPKPSKGASVNDENRMQLMSNYYVDRNDRKNESEESDSSDFEDMKQ